MLRAVLGPKKKTVTEDWRKCLIEELHYLTPQQTLF
jgi:hypothetical protein